MLVPSFVIQQNNEWFNRTKKSQKMFFFFFSPKNRPRSAFENLALKTIFHFIKYFFYRKHSKPPQANICGRDSLRPPRPSFFFWSPPPPFFKIWDWRLPPQQMRGTDTVNMSQMSWDKTTIIWHMDIFFPLQYILGRYADGVEDLTRMTFILS